MDFSFIPDFSSLGGWFYFFMVILLLSATPFPVFATEVVVFLAGALANPVVVGIVAGVAAAIGELTTYVIGRGGEKVISKKRKKGKRYQEAVTLFNRWGFWAVIVFAFTPLPMDLIGLVAGGLRYNAKRFLLATLIGKIPRNIIIAFLGAVGMHLLGF